MRTLMTIYHGVCDRFIELLKVPSDGRIGQKRDSSCAAGVTIYHGVRDRFIEPLKAPSDRRIGQRRDSSCARL